MKILQVNKFYYPKRGADKYFLFLEKMLTAHGHEVRVFAMTSKLNLPSNDSTYFSSEIDLHSSSWSKKIKAAGSIIYNINAKRQFARLLQDFKPDIIHCHNIYHQLSPSILDAARQAKIPVVMHLHDYKLICPNYRLYTQGQYCQRCRGGNYTQCIKHRCIENNLAKSILAASEMSIHHQLLKIYKKGIKFFIAPSIFMRDICVDFGWPTNKFKILENISPIGNNDLGTINDIQDYFLYFGALEEEKGVDLLLRAAAKNQKKIKIAGIGTEMEKLKTLGKQLKVEVEFLGQLQGDKLQTSIKQALAVVIPSRWPENMPLNAIEAMNLGKTVIAANIGGLSELIQTGVNGYLVSPQNEDALSKQLKFLTPEQAHTIGQAAHKSRLGKDEAWHYQKLIKIYQEALNNKPLD